MDNSEVRTIVDIKDKYVTFVDLDSVLIDTPKRTRLLKFSFTTAKVDKEVKVGTKIRYKVLACDEKTVLYVRPNLVIDATEAEYKYSIVSYKLEYA